jgi:PleD family two-component response regulator
MDNKTVLVAVNDIFFYTKVRDALKPQGYILEKARAGDDVVAKAQSLKPAAIVLNINDESLDAFKALEALKSHESSKSIPILAFANHEEVENWKRAQKLGVSKIVSRNEFSSKTLQLVQEVIAQSGKGTRPTGLETAAGSGRVGENDGRGGRVK